MTRSPISRGYSNPMPRSFTGRGGPLRPPTWRMRRCCWCARETRCDARTAGRITGAAGCYGDDRHRSHRSGVVRPSRGGGGLRTGVQCRRGAAMGSCRAGGLLRGERSRIRDGGGRGSGPCRFAGGPLCAGVGLPGAVLRSAPASRRNGWGRHRGTCRWRSWRLNRIW